MNWINETVTLDDLQPWGENPKSIGKAQAKRLLEYWAEIGQFQTVAVGPTNGNGKHPVYDGHQRLHVLKAAHGGKFPIDVRVSSRALDDDERAKLVVQAHAGTTGQWDWDALAAWDTDTLQSWGMDADLLQQWNVDAAGLGLMLDSGQNNGEGQLNLTIEDVYTKEQIIDAAFIWFRDNGFPYRDLAIHVSMQEINKLSQSDNLINSNYGYHVADTYHPHRFQVSASGMKSPFEAFNDDKLLRKALSLNQEYNYSIPQGAFGQMWIVSGVQAAANFRPGFACHLYREYCPQNAVVLDTSTGYGGRLIGAIASGVVSHYIGIDPNTDTHNGNIKMSQELYFADKVELYNKPAEDVLHETVKDRCDFAFTSPPYFSKEHYSDEETQSWKRYPTGEEWCDGFLIPMMKLQFAALKDGCYSIVNIADIKIKNKTYPLLDWATEAGKQAGFTLVEIKEFPLARRFGAGMKDEVANEPVIVFLKNTGKTPELIE